MTTDLAGNQIAGFYPGASSYAEQISVVEVARDALFGFVGPTTREAMRRHAQEFGESNCRLIYDASQQVVSLSEEELLEGIGYAWGIIGSDYEMAVIGQKTGLSVNQLVERVPFVGVTLGSFGSELYLEGQHVKIPPAEADPLRDPTGGGDAYRAGIFKGLMLGLPLEAAGRMGSMSATYAVEQHGTQEHHYSADEFVERFDRVFPDYAGAIEVDWLQHPVDRDRALERLSKGALRGV